MKLASRVPLVLRKESTVGDTDPAGCTPVFLFVAIGDRLLVDMHHVMFVLTLESQADEEQQAKWLPLARGYKVLDACVLTELGYDLDVQGLEIVADCDVSTQEFIAHQLMLMIRMWCPVFLDQEGQLQRGEFLAVQLHSFWNHRLLFGIEMGDIDIGLKIGSQSIDKYHCVLHNAHNARGNITYGNPSMHPVFACVSLKNRPSEAQVQEANDMMELADLAPLLLRKERVSGDVDPAVLAPILRGGADANARRKRMEQLIASHPVLSRRDFVFQNHTERYNAAVEKMFHYVKLLQTHGIDDPVDQQFLYVAVGDRLPVDVHRAMFVPTLENQADEEQQAKWLPLARDYKILGAYAQTELGHGSNVQGLETVAHYDMSTQEFIIHSPTLTSRKWWPGGLGKTATHAIVHARLFLDQDGQPKRDVGIQAFLVQLRSLEDHEPLPGIEVGDIGPKIGFQSIDNGYCAFHNVRIPRENMMMRYAKVFPDGTFVKPKSDKLVYLTMVQVRAYMILKFGYIIGSAATITTRFSATRVQGRRADGNKGEVQVLDYQNQQNALFPYIASSYAATFAGNAMRAMHDRALEIIKQTRADGESAQFAPLLAELHAVSSGMKAWLADHVGHGIEALRRLCGGHGFTQSSNLAHIFSEIVGASTYEGTSDVLVQQHARYLVKVISAASADSSNTAFLRDVRLLRTKCSAQTRGDLNDLSLLLTAFKVRATRAAQDLVRAMAEKKKSSQAAGDSNKSNAHMVLMTKASTAHAEYMLLHAFVEGVDTIPAGTSRDAVATLCTYFATWLMVASLGEFREHDDVSSVQGEWLREQLVALLPVVRKNAVLLTDAWDFSDFELNSTIGRYDGDIYRALIAHAAREPLNRTQVAESYDKYLRPLIRSDL
ncbi:Acyl-coenzyme a oxidase, partial [Globisporangium splendens]